MTQRDVRKALVISGGTLGKFTQRVRYPPTDKMKCAETQKVQREEGEKTQDVRHDEEEIRTTNTSLYSKMTCPRMYTNINKTIELGRRTYCNQM